MHCDLAILSPDVVNWTDHGEVFNLNDVLETVSGNNGKSNIEVLRVQNLLI